MDYIECCAKLVENKCDWERGDYIIPLFSINYIKVSTDKGSYVVVTSDGTRFLTGSLKTFNTSEEGND